MIEVGIWEYGQGPKDWIAAATKEDAIIAIKSVTDYEDDWGLRRITDEEMDKLLFTDEDAPDDKRTFREELERLKASGEKFPAMFASTEF